MHVYVLNPGSTSTKLGLADVVATLAGVSATVTRLEVQHPDLGPMEEATLGRLRDLVREASRDWPPPSAVSARGGLLGPVSAGTYRVTPNLAERSLASPDAHPANAGAKLALEWAAPHGVPAYVVDPPTVDELLPEARLTGVPGLERRSRFHALNARAVARRAAREVGRRLDDVTIVVAHLGGGGSVTVFHNGRAVDTTGALLDEGPFSAQRAGSLPTHALLDLAYSGPREEVEARLTTASGFAGLLGTADLREVEAREADDPAARLAVAAYILGIVKAIGAYAAAAGRPHAVAITGGAARWKSLVERLERRVGWIAPVVVVPGELELEALAEGAGRVLLGLEPALEWKPQEVKG